VVAHAVVAAALRLSSAQRARCASIPSASVAPKNYLSKMSRQKPLRKLQKITKLVMSAMGLSSVLLLVPNARPERWPLLVEYRRFFLGVLFVGGARLCRQAVSSAGLCHVADTNPFAFYTVVSDILTALAHARSHPRAAALPAWATALHASVGGARLGGATGLLVAHMDFFLNPALFGRGLRPEVPWRLPPGLVPKHAPSRLRLLRPLAVTSDADGHGETTATLQRGATVRFSASRGLEYRRYGPKQSIPIIVIGNDTRFELAGSAGGASAPSGWVGGPTLGDDSGGDNDDAAAAGGNAGRRGRRHRMLPPPLSGARGQTPMRHHADYVLDDYYFGGCFQAEALRAERSWFWGFSSRNTGAAAAANLSALLPSLAASSAVAAEAAARVHARGEACAGWIDLFHLPVGAWREVAALAAHYARHGVWHEVAVPTMLHILSNGSDPAREDLIAGCFGCCCCSPAKGLDPAILVAQYPCGHRLNLADARTRDAFVAMLAS